MKYGEKALVHQVEKPMFAQLDWSSPSPPLSKL